MAKSWIEEQMSLRRTQETVDRRNVQVERLADHTPEQPLQARPAECSCESPVTRISRVQSGEVDQPTSLRSALDRLRIQPGATRTPTMTQAAPTNPDAPTGEGAAAPRVAEGQARPPAIEALVQREYQSPAPADVTARSISSSSARRERDASSVEIAVQRDYGLAVRPGNSPAFAASRLAASSGNAAPTQSSSLRVLSLPGDPERLPPGLGPPAAGEMFRPPTAQPFVPAPPQPPKFLERQDGSLLVSEENLPEVAFAVPGGFDGATLAVLDHEVKQYFPNTETVSYADAVAWVANLTQSKIKDLRTVMTELSFTVPLTVSNPYAIFLSRPGLVRLARRQFVFPYPVDKDTEISSLEDIQFSYQPPGYYLDRRGIPVWIPGTPVVTTFLQGYHTLAAHIRPRIRESIYFGGAGLISNPLASYTYNISGYPVNFSTDTTAIGRRLVDLLNNLRFPKDEAESIRFTFVANPGVNDAGICLIGSVVFEPTAISINYAPTSIGQHTAPWNSGELGVTFSATVPMLSAGTVFRWWWAGPGQTPDFIAAVTGSASLKTKILFPRSLSPGTHNIGRVILYAVEQATGRVAAHERVVDLHVSSYSR